MCPESKQQPIPPRCARGRRATPPTLATQARAPAIRVENGKPIFSVIARRGRPLGGGRPPPSPSERTTTAPAARPHDAAVPAGLGRRAVDLGVDRKAKAIVAGAYHTCVLLDDQSVKCWGVNTLGQLGLGSNTPYIGGGPNDMGNNLTAVDVGVDRKAKAIAAGAFHTCVIVVNDDSVKCWGYNDQGQLGQGKTDLHIGQGNKDMGDNLPPVDLGGGRKAKAIAAGNGHNCVLVDADSVMCWGGNTNGQLGLGSSANSIGGGPNEMGNNLTAVLVPASCEHPP